MGADCAPVMVADPRRGLIGVAHCGRPGLGNGVLDALVGAMRDLGAGPLVGRVGPAICGRCYEVPAELHDEIAARVPAASATTRWGTPGLDIGWRRARRAAPARRGRRAPRRLHVRGSGDAYSYRRDGVTGRLAGIAWRSTAERRTAGSTRGQRSNRRARVAANLERSGAGSRPRATRPVVTRRDHAGRRDEDVPGRGHSAAGRARRHRRRREPRPGGSAQGAGVRRSRPALALRRTAADQQGAVGRDVRRRRALRRPRPPRRPPSTRRPDGPDARSRLDALVQVEPRRVARARGSRAVGRRGDRGPDRVDRAPRVLPA